MLLNVLKLNGAILIDPVEIDAIGKLDDNEMTVMLYELKADMKSYFKHRGSDSLHSA